MIWSKTEEKLLDKIFVSQLLKVLTEEEKKVINMFFWEGHTNMEIADFYNLNCENMWHYPRRKANQTITGRVTNYNISEMKRNIFKRIRKNYLKKIRGEKVRRIS